MKNISFVVQGPIISNSDLSAGIYSTAAVLTSIRQHYPDAEIVLSTWKGTDTTGLEYDHVVLNDDPGAIVIPGVNPFNHNRLIVSSKNGIEQASNDFVVKTRTDILFTNSNILSILHHIATTTGTYSIFSHFILSTNYYVRNPFRLRLLFHASDIILIGKKADLQLFFSAPTVTYKDMVIDDKDIKMVAEQYLTVNSIKISKNKEFDFANPDPVNFSHFIKSEKYLFNSFAFFSPDDFGVTFPKKLLFAFMPEANYSLPEIGILSKRYQRCNWLNAYSYLRTLKFIYSRLRAHSMGKKVLQKVNKLITT